ncbi:hypothetical protein NBRC10513v2_007026 [Rhodotorula toruloides]
MPPGSAAIAIVKPGANHPSLSPTAKPARPPAATASQGKQPGQRGAQVGLRPPASPVPAAPSTPLSVAAASAAEFVPGGSSSTGGGSDAGSRATGTMTPGGSTMAAKAAEFVPRRAVTPALSEDAPFFTPAGQQQAPSAPGSVADSSYGRAMAEANQQTAEGLSEYYQQAMDLNAPDYTRPMPGTDPSASLNPYNFAHALAPPGANGGAPGLPGLGHAAAAAAAEAAYYHNGMGAMHPAAMGFQRQPLQYHLYHPLPSTNPRHLSSNLSSRTGSHSPTTSFFLPPALHISLTQKSEATQTTPSVDLKLPEEVGGYTGLVPLDRPPSEGGGGGVGWVGYRGWVYKAWKEGEGRCYALRRIEGFRLQHEAAIAAVEKWTRVRHPGLVGVREAFTTRAFGDHSIIFVYDFHPCSQTLYEAHLSPLASLPPNPWSTPLTHHHHPAQHHVHHGPHAAHASPFRPGGTLARPAGSSPSSTPAGGANSTALPERVLWSYVVQLASALKCVHNSGLAMRTVDVNRVLVTGKNRVRLGGGGVLDCLTWDGGQNIPAHQQDDLLSFGKLIIALACGSTSAVHNLPKSVDHISRMYSPDLKNVVLYLLSKPGPRKTIEEVLALMGPRVVDELNSSLVAEDTLEHELMRELENGRLVRLLTKFGFINERPEFDHDPRWAETGDRYLIKLFRDYVFHQVDETGRPVTDLSHVLTALNKLDAGVDEKIMLVSRDEQSCLIVSYREIKNCIESAFADLSRATFAPHPHGHQQAGQGAGGQATAMGGSSSSGGGSAHWRDGAASGVYAHAPELTHYLQSTFVPSVVPQQDEYDAKEQARQYLEKLADQVSPGAKLLPFGSMANGFALKNSDMDLCCFLAKDAPVRSPSELVELLGRLIEQETNFYVKTLPRARIPIIKLTMPPTASVPAGMACDIGFENRLALENTRLLLTYAMVDARLRTLVLFLKVWTKRRKINNPYRGTLSSYGYVLLVIHFLAHVKQPPILPNLQRLPLPESANLDELTFEGHDISFFDDVDALPSVFQTTNGDSVGELLIDFFRYFSKEFNYAGLVVSIRSEAGTMQKTTKGWHIDIETDPEGTVRDQHKLCIEDPFQLDYNVARTVTKDGLYTIRGEFMRAFRILTTPSRSPEGIGAVINSLCEEREDYLLIHPSDDPYGRLHAPLHHQSPHYGSHAQQKSPRRRSAPSPRMAPTLYGAGLHHQPPPLGQASMSRDHPLWAAAMNGTAAGAVHQPPQLGRAIAGLAITSESSGGEAVVSAGPASENGDDAPHLVLGDAFEPSTGTGASGMYPHPTSIYALAGAALRHPHAHHQPLVYPYGSNTGRLAPQHMSTPPTVAGSPPPSEAGGNSFGGHERRASWDGELKDGSAAGAERGKLRTPSMSGAGGGGSYDLHRFFQNPPSSSMSDAGGPTASSPPVTSASTNARGSVSLTAPSSPELAAQSAYFAGHPTSHYSTYGGRSSQYRYGASAASAAASGSYAHVGPRLAASVPRNPHTAHHAYTNPYASAPVPYPLASTSTSTTSSAYTSPNPAPAAYPLGANGNTASPAAPAPPAPIFPEEDREAIALANSITFGNFPELLPLPSYAHYHASGGSAAYLAGAGGWGSTPYGISGPMRVGNRTHGPGGGPSRGGPRQSLSSTAEDEDGESAAEFEDEADAAEIDERGRERRPSTDETLSEGRAGRSRGRSVPHVRMGPDGRETLLFGAIEVTLPKAEDTDDIDWEDESDDDLRRSPGNGGADGQAVLDERDQDEREVAFLGPTPSAAPSAPQTTAASTEEIPPHAPRSIPVLTTQPPTPAKAPHDPAVDLASPSRASRSRTSSPLLETSGSALDDEMTPRPASPVTATANGWATLPHPALEHVSNSADVPAVVTVGTPETTSPASPLVNGIAAIRLSDAENDDVPPMPSSPRAPRSPKAEKRARQKERRRSSSSTVSSSSPVPQDA